MIGNLPTFSPNMTFNEVSAHEMNTFVNEFKRVREIVDAISQPAAGKPSQAPRERIVALVEEPTAESRMLSVRRIRYASLPPLIGEYEWDWDHFEVYPAHGFTCEEYKAYYVDPSKAAPPADTVFLRAERRESVWILHPPPIGAGGAVVIRGIPEGGEWGFALSVQRVILPEDGDKWEPIGVAFKMPTLPLTPAIFWKHRVLPGDDAPIETGDIQLTRPVDGVECVDLYMPFFAVERRSDDPYRGPRPVGP